MEQLTWELYLKPLITSRYPGSIPRKGKRMDQKLGQGSFSTTASLSQRVTECCQILLRRYWMINESLHRLEDFSSIHRIRDGSKYCVRNRGGPYHSIIKADLRGALAPSRASFRASATPMRSEINRFECYCSEHQVQEMVWHQSLSVL